MSAYTLKQAQIKEWRKKKKTAWGFQKPLATVLQIARLKPNLALLLNVQIFVIPFSEYRGRLGGMIAIGLSSHEATTILLLI